jgi:DNA-binding transcriptional LysR family regulator
VNLRQLRHLIAVADAGSFSAAAAAVGISQPSLSVSIKALETELGDQLLMRGPRGAALTPVGETFVTYARSILREADKAVDEVRQIQGLKRGRVTVGVMSVFSTFIAPQALARFNAAHPNIDVTVDVSTHVHDAVVANLESGAWDFAFALHRVPHEFPASLAVAPVACFESDVYAGRDHPLARRKRATLADMAGFDWVVSSAAAGAGLLTRVFDQAGLTRPAIRVVSNSFGLVRELVQQSPLLCMLPRRYARRELAAGQLARIRQNDIAVRSNVGLISPAAKALTPAARHLAEAFRAAGQAEFALANAAR